MSYTIDLESYPNAAGTDALAQWFYQAHPEFEKRAVYWAFEILKQAAKLEGAMVDPRNYAAVAAAKRALAVRYLPVSTG